MGSNESYYCIFRSYFSTRLSLVKPTTEGQSVKVAEAKILRDLSQKIVTTSNRTMLSFLRRLSLILSGLQLSLLCWWPSSHDTEAGVSAYEATWESLDSRPLPPWYDEAKFGIFIHWGVFSVPSFGTEWFWYKLRGKKDKKFVDYVTRTERAGFVYEEYAPRFTAHMYNPNEWANLFANSGAQYVVLTSKHHEGYCNWDSRNVTSTWHWNSMDVGSHRDLVGELSHAIKHSGIKSKQTNRTLRFGLYHSLFEWFNL